MGWNEDGGDNDIPVWLRDSHPIEVDVGTLAQFGRALQDEVGGNLRPHIDRIFDGLDQATSPFARKPGFLELLDAWFTYGSCKYETLAVLDLFADATEELAKAAQILAANYRSTDQLAAARLSDVRQAFTQAAKPPPEVLD